MAQTSVEVVRGVYEAFARGDVAGVFALMTEDVEWHEAEGMPYGGVHRGPQEIGEKVLGPMTSDVEGFAVTPEEVIGSGDTVAAVCRYTGTGKASGRELDIQVAHLWDVRDGKVVRFRQYIDTVRFREVVPDTATV